MSSNPVLNRCTLLLALGAALAGCSDPESSAMRDKLDQVTSEVDSLRAGRRVLEDRLAATRVAAKTAGEYVRRLEGERNAAVNSAARWRDAHQSLAGRLGARERELVVIRSGMARLQGELAASARGLQALEGRNAALARQMAALTGWLGQQTAQSQSQGNALKRTEGDLVERARTAKGLAERMEGIREQLEESNSAVADLRASNRELDAIARTLNEEMQRTRQDADNRVAELGRNRETLQEQLDGAKVEAAQLGADNEQLKTRMEELRTQLAAANDQADRYRRAREYLDDKLARQDIELANANNAVTELRAQRDEVVNAMSARRDELLGTVSECERAGTAASARVAGLERDVTALLARIAEMEQRAARSSEDRDDLRRSRDYLEGKLSTLNTEVERERVEQKAELVRLEQSLHLAVEEVRLLQQNMPDASAGLDAALAQAATQRGALLRQIAGLRSEVQSLSSARSQGAERREALLAQIAELREEVTRTLAAHSRTEKARHALEEQLASLRAQTPSGSPATTPSAELDVLRTALERTVAERSALEQHVLVLDKRHQRALTAARAGQTAAQRAPDATALRREFEITRSALDRTVADRVALEQHVLEQDRRHARALEAVRLEREDLARRVDELTSRATIYAQTLGYLTDVKSEQDERLRECEPDKQ